LIRFLAHVARQVHIREPGRLVACSESPISGCRQWAPELYYVTSSHVVRRLHWPWRQGTNYKTSPSISPAPAWTRSSSTRPWTRARRPASRTLSRSAATRVLPCLAVKATRIVLGIAAAHARVHSLRAWKEKPEARPLLLKCQWAALAQLLCAQSKKSHGGSEGLSKKRAATAQDPETLLHQLWSCIGEFLLLCMIAFRAAMTPSDNCTAVLLAGAVTCCRLFTRHFLNFAPGTRICIT
jgi:hypothetical protein